MHKIVYDYLVEGNVCRIVYQFDTDIFANIYPSLLLSCQKLYVFVISSYADEAFTAKESETNDLKAGISKIRLKNDKTSELEKGN